MRNRDDFSNRQSDRWKSRQRSDSNRDGQARMKKIYIFWNKKRKRKNDQLIKILIKQPWKNFFWL